MLDRHHLADRSIREHHAAGVDAEVPRRLQQLGGELDDILGDRVRTRVSLTAETAVSAGVAAEAGNGLRSELQRATLHLLAPGILLPGGVAECLRHVAHGVLGPVLDHVRDLRGVAPPVLLEHPLDDLLTAIGVEVDVDVGLLVAQARQEALERQPVVDRVDRGDVEQVADGRVGGGAAPLAEDAAAAREGDDVVHDEEVAGEVLLLDHRELVLDALPILVRQVRVLARHRAPDQLAQPRHRGVPLGHLLLRQSRLGAAQREGELFREFDATLDGAGVAREPRLHLVPRAQVRAARGGKPAVELVKAALRAHGGDRGRESAILGTGVVHVAGRHDRQAALGGEGSQDVVVGAVERQPVVDELDVHVLGAEQRHQTVELGRRLLDLIRMRSGRRLRWFARERLPHRPLAASGEDRPVTVGGGGELVEVVDGAPLLGAAQLRLGDGGREPVVALEPPRQHEQMSALRIGLPVLRTGEPERELGPEHRGDLRRLGRLGEPHDAVEAVVVGDRERTEPQPFRLLEQRLGAGGSVEEAEAGVRVQFGVGHGSRVAHALRRRDVGPALAREGRVECGDRARPRERALELAPLDRRILPAHQGAFLMPGVASRVRA